MVQLNGLMQAKEQADATLEVAFEMIRQRYWQEIPTELGHSTEVMEDAEVQPANG